MAARRNDARRNFNFYCYLYSIYSSTLYFMLINLKTTNVPTVFKTTSKEYLVFNRILNLLKE